MYLHNYQAILSSIVKDMREIFQSGAASPHDLDADSRSLFHVSLILPWWAALNLHSVSQSRLGYSH